MVIGLGCDHHGLKVKNDIIKYLSDNGVRYIDYGCNTSDNIDYIDYACKVCDGVLNNECDLGILICATGIGMSIAANKHKGIYCGKVDSVNDAVLTKEHNMANVIAVSENIKNINEVISAFINTNNSNEERHLRRFNKIKDIESNNL